MHFKKETSLTDEDIMDKFCEKYIIEKKLERTSLEHFQLLEINNNRKREENALKTLQEGSKEYKDFD